VLLMAIREDDEVIDVIVAPWGRMAEATYIVMRRRLDLWPRVDVVLL
jgi:hypothetical protein